MKLESITARQVRARQQARLILIVAQGSTLVLTLLLVLEHPGSEGLLTPSSTTRSGIPDSTSAVKDHHHGRDAGIVGAGGLAAYEGEKHLGGSKHDPSHPTQSSTGASPATGALYDSGNGPTTGTSQTGTGHHYGRGAGLAGTGGGAAYEAERSTFLAKPIVPPRTIQQTRLLVIIMAGMLPLVPVPLVWLVQHTRLRSVMQSPLAQLAQGLMTGLMILESLPIPIPDAMPLSQVAQVPVQVH